MECELFAPCDRFLPTDDKPVEANCVCCFHNYHEEVCPTLATRFREQLAREGGGLRAILAGEEVSSG